MRLRQVILNTTVGCTYNCPGCYINEGGYVEIATKAFETYIKLLDSYQILETNILINPGLTISKFIRLFEKIDYIMQISNSKFDLLFPIALFSIYEEHDFIGKHKIPFWLSVDVYKDGNSYDIDFHKMLSKIDLFLGYNIYVWDRISFEYLLNFIKIYKNNNFNKPISVVFRKDKYCIPNVYYEYSKYLEENFRDINLHLDCYSSGCIAGNWISILSNGLISMCPIITDYAFDVSKLGIELMKLNRKKYANICINK